MSVVIACVSDVHAGSTVALAPPSIQLDDGGEYHASKPQRWLWQSWLEYWDRVKSVQHQHKAKLVTIFNGDLVEGLHHKNSHLISGNPQSQKLVWTAAAAVPLGMKPDRIYIVKGTEAHAGSEGCSEESIADGLRRDKRPIVGNDETGTAAHWHLRLTVYNTLLDVTHHGRTGQREHTRASAAVLHAHDVFLAHTKNGDRPPDLCLRGHYHKFNDSYDACPTRVVTTGAWQLKTGHVHKVAPDSLADIGGAIVVVTEQGYTVEKVHFRVSRGAPCQFP